MAGGRPTEYSEEILQKAASFIAEHHHGVPTIAGLALFLDIARDTVYDWSDKYPEFSYIVEKLKATQENNLLAGGLDGTFNSSITKLMLTKHGYTDKQDVTSGGEKLPTPILQSVPPNERDTGLPA